MRLHDICSENEDADQLRGNHQLICVFVFAYAKSKSLYDAAHITIIDKSLLKIYMINDTRCHLLFLSSTGRFQITILAYKTLNFTSHNKAEIKLNNQCKPGCRVPIMVRLRRPI